MSSTVFWIAGPWKGRLGIVPRPRGGDWLDDEIKAWRGQGIDLVVSLLEHDEEAQLILEREGAAASAHGIEFKSFPIPDRSVPASLESVGVLAGELVEALEKGKSVVVHCRQGIGRSALVTAALLIVAGQTPESALRAITESRDMEVPETDDQRQWLTDFAASLLATPAARAGSSPPSLRRVTRVRRS